MSVTAELKERFPDTRLEEQQTADGVATLWLSAADLLPILGHLQHEISAPFRTLYDLTAIDERTREHRDGQPPSDLTAVYQLLSYERNEDVRLKVALTGDQPSIPTVTGLWPSADWYERELWDMFGVVADGHPDLRRILMPPWWEGHPLRKEHPSRATEMGTFTLSPEQDSIYQSELEEWRGASSGERMVLNVGPQHPGTHGPFRVVLELEASACCA